MTAPTLPRPAPTSDVVAARVRSRIEDLTQPRTTTTQRWVREAGVDHLVRREVTVTLPPLLVQLAQSVAGSTSGHGSSGTKSRPPGSLEGTDTLRTITREAAYLAGRVLALYAAQALPGLRVSVKPRRLGDSLAVIHRYVDQLDRESLADVDAAVRGWWAHARVVTTWDSPPLKPYVACPACRVRGRLQVVDQPLAVVCLECSSTWDGMTADELGMHMAIALSAAIPDPVAGADCSCDDEPEMTGAAT